MKNELETLRAELHKEVDAKIDKLIKPKFEVGKWYKYKNTKLLLYPTKIKRVMDAVTGYGFNADGEWLDECNDWGLEGCIEATHTEVQEALEKEAVKRGFKEGVKYKNMHGSIGIIKEKCFVLDDNDLGQRNNDGCNFHYIMEKGQWATPIKTMTIDELAKQFKVFIDSDEREDFKLFLTENKTQIIETLNNL